MKKRILLVAGFSFLSFILAGTSCGNTETTDDPGDNPGGDTTTDITAHDDIEFTYENVADQVLSNPSTNKLDGAYEDFDAQLEDLTVNKVDALEGRDDFAFGVDASMIHDIEEAGGVFYNEEGYETDIFTLLRQGGANYFRVRLWNDPTNSGITYGGGTNNLETDIELAKRAQEVGMNILVDFHYSDFWADPDYQVAPKEWSRLSYEDLLTEVETFTKESIEAFADAGVTVNAVQIGNEINNGLIDGFGDIDWANVDESFKRVSEILTAGIKGARSANDDIYTIIHLANGGSWDEFETFFTQLEKNNVPYDIIGASYYPFYHGSLDLLAENLQNCAETFDKPVMVMETSYGNTIDDEGNEWVGNTYNASFEDDGGYLTSVQGQMTSLRDVVDTVANINNDMGLGVFYWEPTMIPVAPVVDQYGITEVSAGWATAYGLCYKNYNNNQNVLDAIAENEDNNLNKSTWANQGFFNYSGQALPSLYTYSYIKEGLNEKEEIPLQYRDSAVTYTYNRADEDDTLPETVKVETNLDAIRNYEVTWDEVDLTKDGTFTVTGAINWSGLPVDGRLTINLNLTVIQNYIRDGGFEKQIETSTSDNLGGDWEIYSTSPDGEKVVKLNRKPVDVRTGTTDVNFFYSVSSFGFDFGQDVVLDGAGTYSLTSYLMGIDMSDYEGTIEMYVSFDGDEESIDALQNMTGWSTGYRPLNIEFTVSDTTTVRVGYRAEGLSADVWGHIDDFELVRLS